MTLEKSYKKYNEIFDIITTNMDSWRDPIESGYIGEKVMVKNNWTKNDIIKSVEFFTATTPTLTLERYNENWGGNGYRINALGYRLGPAGS
ncbi:hypothetical protein H8D04_00625 [bacterium]|nr:hypothetical protein [bacterium]